jgi:hypothetical protein
MAAAFGRIEGNSVGGNTVSTKFFDRDAAAQSINALNRKDWRS